MASLTSRLTGAAVAALGALAAATPVQAQLSRTFVSVVSGNDAHDCSRAAPCRTFQVAHDRTTEQGEITVLDPGHYGAVTITRAISIINRGAGEAGVLPTDGSAITINAPAAANIVLRGLTIEGAGFGGGTGISHRHGDGKYVRVASCAGNGSRGRRHVREADARRCRARDSLVGCLHEAERSSRGRAHAWNGKRNERASPGAGAASARADVAEQRGIFDAAQ